MSPTEKPLNALLFSNKVSVFLLSVDMVPPFFRDKTPPVPIHARSTPAPKPRLLLPGEGQRTAEVRREALGFFCGGAARPGRWLCERLDLDLDSAAFELVPPGSFHAPVDQQNRRDPTLR